jgi:hypothetical protein
MIDEPGCSCGRLIHVGVQAKDQRQPEGSRINVVGGLAEVDVIVRMDHRVVALRTAEAFEREIGDDFIGVHVGRRACPALDEVGDELVAHLAGDQRVARSCDRIRDPRVEHTQIAIRKRCSLLHIAERLDEVRLERHRYSGDVEIFLPAQRLHAVVGVVGKLAFAQEVFFDAWHGPSSSSSASC